MKIVTSIFLGVTLVTVTSWSCETFFKTDELQSIQGTFDTDSQEWKIQNLASDQYVSSLNDLSNLYNPIYSETGGNPGGFLYHADRNNGVWYFAASDTFVKKARGCYGQTLTFDLRQSATDQQVEANDVVLIGGGVQLVYKTPNNPGVDWTTYAVRLDSTGLWRTESAGVATEKEMQQVLNRLEKLFIRGEHRGGADTGGLDNVFIK